jgi:hypothetical protein
MAATLGKYGGSAFMGAMGRIGQQGVVEAIQEGPVQQVLQNFIAMGYNPAATPGEGVAHSTGVGGAVGVVAAGVKEGVSALSAWRGRRGRQAEEDLSRSPALRLEAQDTAGATASRNPPAQHPGRGTISFSGRSKAYIDKLSPESAIWPQRMRSRPGRRTTPGTQNAPI